MAHFWHRVRIPLWHYFDSASPSNHTIQLQHKPNTQKQQTSAATGTAGSALQIPTRGIEDSGVNQRHHRSTRSTLSATPPELNTSHYQSATRNPRLLTNSILYLLASGVTLASVIAIQPNQHPRRLARRRLPRRGREAGQAHEADDGGHKRRAREVRALHRAPATGVHTAPNGVLRVRLRRGFVAAHGATPSPPDAG
jgi:hypothetical protein